MEEFLAAAIGTEDNITWWQMAIRAVIIFIVAIALVRLSNKRIFGKHSAFDIVMGIVLGSILSRAITANSPFFPTIIAATVLVLMHRLMGTLAATTKWGDMFKGTKQVLIKDGELLRDKMRESSISENDLLEAMRLQANTSELKSVKRAYLERSGDISIIMKD